MVFLVTPALAVVGADSKFLHIEFDGIADELVVAPGGAPVLRAFQIDLAATALVGVWFALKSEQEDGSVHGNIEHSVDVVFVPDFKEGFCPLSDAGDLAGTGQGCRLLGGSDRSGSKKDETEREGARYLHEERGGV